MSQETACIVDQADWTFRKANVREFTHCFHDYPARMIPQVARQLLAYFGQKDGVLFDPYCGTGTTLVEALIAQMHAVGTDINPLARLIATSKTTVLEIVKLRKLIADFERVSLPGLFRPARTAVTPPRIPNIDFWFKPRAIEDLCLILQFTDAIADSPMKTFFEVAFSETVRESSNTKPGEFKLFRRGPSALQKFNMIRAFPVQEILDGEIARKLA